MTKKKANKRSCIIRVQRLDELAINNALKTFIKDGEMYGNCVTGVTDGV
jgi:hypothetical protein